MFSSIYETPIRAPAHWRAGVLSMLRVSDDGVAAAYIVNCRVLWHSAMAIVVTARVAQSAKKFFDHAGALADIDVATA